MKLNKTIKRLGSVDKPRCQGIKRDKKQCEHIAKLNSDFCRQHDNAGKKLRLDSSTPAGKQGDTSPWLHIVRTVIRTPLRMATIKDTRIR